MRDSNTPLELFRMAVRVQAKVDAATAPAAAAPALEGAGPKEPLLASKEVCGMASD